MSPVSNISTENIDALDRSSPTPSTSSLERYLATPASEEAVPFGALKVQAESIGMESSHTHLSSALLHTPQRAFSTAGSESSASSAISVQSWSSQLSVDSRGSRRGRKRWSCPKKPTTASTKTAVLGMEQFLQDQAIEPVKMLPPSKHRAVELGIFNGDTILWPHPQEPPNETESDKAVSHAYFCTWPGCSSTFRHPFEWVRHEEAVHYCPFHWICCSERSLHTPNQPSHCFICGERHTNIVQHLIREHFTQCAEKPQSERTFLRQDQLAQHIKRVHFKPVGVNQAIPKWLFDLWKLDNPQLLVSPSFLRCGFCGETCSSWIERQEHVSKHMKDGACKLAWWPDRAPAPALEKKEADTFTCPTCSQQFISATVAAQLHPQCESWSCRYLHDMHSIFKTCQSSFTVLRSECTLCYFEVVGRDRDGAVYTDFLTSHAETHSLRSCDQEIFYDREQFKLHLIDKHARIKHRRSHHTSFAMSGLHKGGQNSWRRVQFLERYGTKVIMRTLLPFEENVLCPSKQHGYTTQVVGEIQS
ncbi:Nn.00g117900.m01.CDS01 [Neocucurbitaria sp. VM-36]